MTFEELEEKYSRIPQEIKQIKRWVCYRIEVREDKKTKVPYNSVSGQWARTNDPSTWSSFRIAIMGCAKYGFDGIGFVLGKDTESDQTYFGVDLDNHPGPDGEYPMNHEKFMAFASEFIRTLKSYAEYSPSGKGFHIICKGTLPEGAKRKAGVAVEMYDKGRFFTMTGDTVNNYSINERTNEVVSLWEKYLKPTTPVEAETVNDGAIVFGENFKKSTIETSHNLSDDELIERIRNSREGAEFDSLFSGDISGYDNDHSAADLALCTKLAFWTGCNKAQMDRIFRKSGLMREKWNKLRGQDTYGEITLNKAISGNRDVYTPPKEKTFIIENIKPSGTVGPQTEIVQFDERNDPIVSIKSIFKFYPLDDTGNAERFYDYFGDYFKYNTDNDCFMFWNGKTWIRDKKMFVRKYANKMIEILQAEIKNTDAKIEDAAKKGEEGEAELVELNELRKAQAKNAKRVADKAGKDAMLSELKALHDLPVVNKEFDTQENLLNTDSGVVDLNTGEIKPFDRRLKLSKNTNCKISFEEPTTFLKFLHDICDRQNEEETKEVMDTIQMALGESLTGRTNKEHLFIMYGNGSNGKSTFISIINKAFGDYGTSMNSDMLIQNPNSSSQSNEFALSSLLGARIVITSETAEGKRLDEVTIKRMLSGEEITAQYKYGQQFTFMPTFSPWMSTNNRPIIRATDFGTWRRIFYIPFLNTFSGEKKDVEMPKKLEAELPKILGWMIQGAVKLHKEYQDKLPKPQCLEKALSEYKQQLDVLASFLSDRCIPFAELSVPAETLYNAYKDWAKTNNEYLFPEGIFKLEIPKKGYPRVKDPNKGWVYTGLKLATSNKGIQFGENEAGTL